jgi:hypothetical protein
MVRKMSYTLTYEIEDLPVGGTEISGGAEIEFRRDGSWWIEDLIVTPMPHLRQYPVVDWLMEGKIRNALMEHKRQDIQEAVDCAIANLEPLHIEREIASYEHWMD